MTKKYITPTQLQIFMSRLKRRTPAFAVDLIDNSFRNFIFSHQSHLYSKESNEEQPFFIVGSGRSGSTLLRKLLVERTDVSIPPENPGLGNTIREYTRSKMLPWDVCVNRTVKRFIEQADVDVHSSSENGVVYNLYNDLDIDFVALKRGLNALDVDEQTLSGIITSIYNAYSIQKYGRVKRWGDKTPWNVFHYDRIKKVYPKAKYIHMVRDGRDCVASYVESLGYLMNMDVYSAALRWRDSVAAARAIKKDCSINFLEVRYEDLVGNTEQTLSRVMRFLELRRVPAKKIDLVALGEQNSSHHKRLNFPIDNTSVERWRRDFSDDDLKIVNSIISKELNILGYI